MPDVDEKAASGSRESSPGAVGGMEPVIAIGLSLVLVLCVLLAATTVIVLVADVAAGDEHNATFANGSEAPTATATATPEPTATPTPEPTPERDSGDDSGDDEPPDYRPSTSELSIDELRQGGNQIDGAAPSMRWLSDSGAVYVDYADPNPLAFNSGEDWESGKMLKPGELVETHRLRMHAQRNRNAEPQTVYLIVTYWQTEEREYTVDDETRTETVLANTTVDQKELELAGAFDSSDLTLRTSDGERYVTMWLVDEDGNEISGAQWTFRQRTAATTQSAEIGSWGDLLAFIGKWIAIPQIIGIVSVALMCGAGIRQAKRGPGKGLLFWGIFGGAALILAVAIGWYYLANWIVGLPLLIPIALSIVTGIVILETWEENTREVEFWKPALRFAESPTGDVSLEVLKVESATETLADMGGQTAVVRDGVLRFLSRCFGGAAILEGAADLETRIEVEGDSDASDEMVMVDPRADSALDYEPEGWGLSIPSLSEEGAKTRLGLIAVLTIVFSGTLAWVFVPPVGAAAFVGVALLLTVRPTAGRASVEPASAHARQAFFTAIYLARELDNADTIEEAQKQLIEKEARSKKDVEREIDDRDDRLIKEMFATDVDEAVSSLSPDDEQLEGLLDALEGGDGVDVEIEEKEAPADD